MGSIRNRIAEQKNTPVPVEILAKFVFDQNERIVGIQGTTRDIRERQESEATKAELENLLIQSQKSEVLGALAGGIAHDFNNILHSVIGFSEICLNKVPEGTDVRDHVRPILAAGLRAKELVMQILTFVHQKEVEIKPVQVKWIADEAIRLLNASLPRTIKIVKEISQDAYVLADPVQIHQVIMNLCTNASHAMRENGGILGVEIRPAGFDKPAPQKPQDLVRGECVMIAISDTGPGMTVTEIARIFEPYYTTKSQGEGTGIGLSVVKSIINKLNGMIEVSSSPGKGSVFRVYLPATTEAPEEPEEPEEPAITEEMLVGGNECILFVDDEPSIAALGEQILRMMGYRVKAFENSREAVSWLAEHSNDVDLVVSDVTMPGINCQSGSCVSGDKLVLFAREVNPKIPVILCTGYSDRITPEVARELGVSAFLRKPIAKVDLVSAVKSVLDGELLL